MEKKIDRFAIARIVSALEDQEEAGFIDDLKVGEDGGETILTYGVPEEGDVVITIPEEGTEIIIEDGEDLTVLKDPDSDVVLRTLAEGVSLGDGEMEEPESEDEDERTVFQNCVLYPVAVTSAGVVFKDHKGREYIAQDEGWAVTLKNFKMLFDANREHEMLGMPTLYPMNKANKKNKNAYVPQSRKDRDLRLEELFPVEERQLIMESKLPVREGYYGDMDYLISAEGDMIDLSTIRVWGSVKNENFTNQNFKKLDMIGLGFDDQNSIVAHRFYDKDKMLFVKSSLVSADLDELEELIAAFAYDVKDLQSGIAMTGKDAMQVEKWLKSRKEVPVRKDRKVQVISKRELTEGKEVTKVVSSLGLSPEFGYVKKVWVVEC
jgi:hypothetical protein